MASDHGAPQRDSLAKYTATFYAGLLLAQRGDLAPQPSIFLLQRFTRHGRPRAGRLVLQARHARS